MSANIIPVFFNQVQLSVQPDDVHTYLMTTAEVAKGYGVSDQNIRDQKRRHLDELLANEHFITSVRKTDGRRSSSVAKSDARQYLQSNVTYWTKLGVIYLGFFIKSERAKQFRKFAADLILNEMEKKPKRKALGKGIELPETQKEESKDSKLTNEMLDQFLQQAWEISVKRGGKIKTLLQPEDIFVDDTPIFQRDFAQEIFYSHRRVIYTLFSIRETLGVGIHYYEHNGMKYYKREEVLKIVNWMFDNMKFKPHVMDICMASKGERRP